MQICLQETSCLPKWNGPAMKKHIMIDSGGCVGCVCPLVGYSFICSLAVLGTSVAQCKEYRESSSKGQGGLREQPSIWGSSLPSEGAAFHMREQPFISGSSLPYEGAAFHIREQPSIWESSLSSEGVAFHMREQPSIWGSRLPSERAAFHLREQPSICHT